MVKNITIKDSAYQYLKSKKGDRSFSDLILADADTSKRAIHVTNEVYNQLLEQKTQEQSFSDIISEALQKTSLLSIKDIAKKYQNTITKTRAEEFHKSVTQFRKEMEKELNDRSR
jgi:predicted CopG family antitoxin